MEDRYVEVGGANIRYWAMGSGPPLLLIHGLGASVEYWQQNIEPLSQHCRVYAMDLLGFGRSDKPRIEYSLHYAAQFIADFMDAQGIERASLVGNSMGGLISLQFAIEFPERLDKLVLVDNAGFGRELIWIFRLMTLPVLGEALYGPNERGMRTLQRMLFYDKRFVTDEWVEQNLEMARLPGARDFFLSVLRYGVNLRGLRPEILEPLLAQIPGIEAPTLIVWGAQDRFIPVAHGHIGHRMIAGSRLHIFDRCGHVPQIERAEGFNRLVADFLKGGDCRGQIADCKLQIAPLQSAICNPQSEAIAMEYEDWEAQVPDAIKDDPLWQMEAYRLALFLHDLAWKDCESLIKDIRGREIAKQLIRSVGSISANIEEGYGRGFGRDYARFLSFSVGSARETRGWYYRGRKLLTEMVIEHRYNLLGQIIGLLVTAIGQQRR